MNLNILITPAWDAAASTVSALDVHMEVAGHELKPGERGLAYLRELVTIPACEILDLRVSDDAGDLPFEWQDGEAEMSFVFRRFMVFGRASQGPVNIDYHVLPRVQPEGYRSSPYFDLVAEKGGVLGAGATFLVHPADFSAQLDVKLSWDLAGLPEGARGVWTYGAGDVQRRVDLQGLLFSAYMVGLVNSRETGHAGFYWFDELPFNPDGASEQINLMFEYMARMFHDKGDCYRVFTRRNGFPGSGGTAFPRSYIYGYGKGDEVTLEGLRDLLAHEMVHNWPTMKDDPAGLGTWYVEGSAEYYSTIVPMEMGLRTLDETAEVINEKAGSYFENPMNGLSNDELGKLYWKDRRCQRVPYSRGTLFLSNVDAAIRRATNGEKTLLDVELALLELPEPVPEDFVRAVADVAGLDIQADFDAMCAGEPIVPDPDAFGGLFEPVPCKVHLNDSQHSNEKIYRDDEVDGYRWRVR